MTTWSNLPPNSRRDAANGRPAPRPAPRPGRKALADGQARQAAIDWQAKYDPCATCGEGQGWITRWNSVVVACPICHPGSRSRYIVSPVPDDPPDAYQGAF